MPYLFGLFVLIVGALFFKDMIKLALNMKPKDDKEFFKNIGLIVALVSGVFGYSYLMGKNELFGFLIAIALVIIVGMIYLFSSKDTREPDDDPDGNDNIKREFIDYM